MPNQADDKNDPASDAREIPSEEYVQEYFDIIRRRYLGRDPWMVKRISDVISSLRPRPGETILDIGCGVGTVSLECRKRGLAVTAIDYSATAIRMARELEYDVLGRNEIDYHCLDVKDIASLDRKFDKIVSADFIEHISRPLFESMLPRIADLMQEDAILVLYAPNGSVRPGTIQKIVRLAGLLPLLKKGSKMRNNPGTSRSIRTHFPGEIDPEEKYEYLHVDVKTAAYLYNTLGQFGFRIQSLKVSRSSSRLEVLPYPYNILWGGHLSVVAGTTKAAGSLPSTA